MTTMNVSLPDEMKAYVDSRLASDGYSSTSEYIRALIRQDRDNHGREKLRIALMEGLASGTPIDANTSYWQQKQAALRTAE